MENEPGDLVERTRLERLSAMDRLDPAQASRLLELRAIALASAGNDGEVRQSAIEVVVFRAGRGVFAVPSRAVDQVRELGKIVQLPLTLSVVVGVIVHQAELLAVADLAQLFEGQPSARTSSSRLIVLARERQQLALMSAELVGVRVLDRAILTVAPSTFPAELTRYVEAIDADGTVLLSVRALMNDLLPAA
jgi:chemotaxis signal transduction protein